MKYKTNKRRKRRRQRREGLFSNRREMTFEGKVRARQTVGFWGRHFIR